MRASLGREHLLAGGVPAQRLHDVVVQGVAADGPFAASIVGDRETMDLARAAEDVVAAACELRGARRPADRGAGMHQHAAVPASHRGRDGPAHAVPAGPSAAAALRTRRRTTP
jgi:hypothetical protein